VVPLAQQIVDTVRPDVRNDADDMDIRQWVANRYTVENLLSEVQTSEASKQRNNCRTIWYSSSESHHHHL
jgi:hypothetical protein